MFHAKFDEETLDFSKCIQSITNDSSALKLDISHQKLDDTRLNYVIGRLSVDQVEKLEEINCSHNQISDKGLVALLKMAMNCKNLRRLNLSSNRLLLSPNVVRLQAHFFKLLQQLNLSENQIDDEGICALGEELSHASNPVIQKIYLDNNPFNEDGISALRRVNAFLPGVIESLALTPSALTAPELTASAPKVERSTLHENMPEKKEAPVKHAEQNHLFSNVKIIENYFVPNSEFLKKRP